VGDLVDLADRRRRRDARSELDAPRVQLYVDLADPFSYLTAERVERAFSAVTWRPVCQAALERRDVVSDAVHVERVRAAAERRAAELRLPLQWPDRFPAPVPAAMRAAAHAVERGRGGAFVLAAGRLAFCGGFDLDDPEVLAEAAAAAGVGLDAVFEAAHSPALDGRLEAAARRLLALGADRLPVLRVGHALVHGEAQISALLSAGGPAAALVT
jgi:2-hydroxychromene-2-carboxylate isomerase